MALLEQFLPLPKCGVRNSFTGVVVANASGASRSAASGAALRAARDERDPPMTRDQARTCVGCQGPNSLTTVGHGGVQNIEVDPDAGTWVAQHEAHWMVELRCNGDFDSEVFAPGPPQLAVDRHEEPLVCGKIRRSLGCVIAKVAAPRSLTARQTARAAAKAERDRLQAEDEAKTCPIGCIENPITSTSGGSRLVMARQIRQARRGRRRFWVAYHIAWWSVTHECVVLPEDPIIEEPEGCLPKVLWPLLGRRALDQQGGPDDRLEYFEPSEPEAETTDTVESLPGQSTTTDDK